MANFLICTNSVFAVETKVEGVDDAREAASVGIRGASQMVADDIAGGEPAASVLVSVYDKPGSVLSIYVFAMSVSRLKP